MPRELDIQRARRLIAILLAAVTVFLASASLQRKIASFQPLGFVATLAPSSWEVESVEQESIGFLPGDRIFLVNGEGPASVGDVYTALRQRRQSEVLVQRGEELLTLTYELPRLRIDFPYLILVCVSLGYLLIGFYTLLRDTRKPALIFYAWCLASTVLFVVTPVPPFDLLGKGLYVADEVARLLLPPLTLHLFMIFPSAVLPVRRLRQVLPFFYLPAAILLVLQLDLMAFNGALFSRGPGALAVYDRLELAHLLLFSLSAICTLAWKLLQTSDPERKRQVAWIAVGMAGGYLPFFLLYVIPRLAGLQTPKVITFAAVAPLVLVPMAFAYAILRYKLWDIGAVVRDAVSLSLTVMLGVSAFALTNLAIGRSIPDDFTQVRNLLIFVSGLLIAGVAIPARRGINGSLERVQYGNRFLKRRALAEFGREILEERNLDRLAVDLLQHLRAGLELDTVTLLLVRGDRLLPVQPDLGLAMNPLKLEELSSEMWERSQVVLSGAELPGDQPSGAQKLFNAGYRYLFPLIVQDRRVGAVASGFKQGGIPLGREDTDLLRGLLNQVALAVENAQLLAQVKSQLDEVSRLQQFSEEIIESSPAGICVLDADERIVEANAAFHRIVQAQPGTIGGCALVETLPISPLPHGDEIIREISFCDLNRNEQHLQISVAETANGGLGHHRILVVQDVSEQAAMETALQRKEHLASLGMLAAGVAHEVNTPITGISSYAQMLLSETDQEDPHFNLLKKVETQTFRASRIVNSLLDFARAQPKERRRLAVAPVIGECLELLKEDRVARGIDLDWVSPEQAAFIFANDGEMQQVFTNLFVNAFDAIGEQEGTLTVRVESNEDRVKILIQDTGPGIAPEKIEQIFKPFFSTKIGEGGTGLGLSITHNIIRQHEGTIRVENMAEGGCRFTVVLPRADDCPAPA